MMMQYWSSEPDKDGNLKIPHLSGLLVWIHCEESTIEEPYWIYEVRVTQP